MTKQSTPSGRPIEAAPDDPGGDAAGNVESRPAEAVGGTVEGTVESTIESTPERRLEGDVVSNDVVRNDGGSNGGGSNGAGSNDAESNAVRVRRFHEAIGETPPVRPTDPDPELLTLRRKLIQEEYAEVMEALDRLEKATAAEREERFAEAAHELTDLLYVTYGALVWFGVDADEVFAEVHGANMRKTAGPKREDGKQLKPAGWTPADVAAVVARMRERTVDLPDEPRREAR